MNKTGDLVVNVVKLVGSWKFSKVWEAVFDVCVELLLADCCGIFLKILMIKSS